MVCEYDLQTGNDFTVTLSRGNYTLNGLQNDAYILQEGVDYTVNGNSCTILTAYMDTLSLGEHSITFTMSGGVNPKLTIRVSETRIPDTTVPLAELETGLEQPVVNPFEDVHQKEWFYEDVVYVYLKGLMNGTSTQPMLFSPDLPLSRGMIVTALYRLEESPDVTSLDNPFKDVTQGMWYTAAVQWAAANKIVLGYGDDSFGPDDNITREQLATMIYRYQQYGGQSIAEVSEEYLFVDEDQISSYAKTSVSVLSKQGVIIGKPGNIFDPVGYTTRAEFATILHRVGKVNQY